ncbi:MAG TPA: serine/threonine-protein kinase [Phycisphaerae bacterium]|nr:serine/threonine-protein kinase [Phycisphaerae bacterium]
MSTPQAGDRVNNYLLEVLVGSGSFGQVWRARHHVFDERVAIKIPTDPQYVRNLRHEGVAVHGLRHPNIVRALDLDPYADPPYLIMEFVDGPSLRQVIDANPGGLPIPVVVEITSGLLSALGAAHQGGLIHRDVKPANILLEGVKDSGENLAEITRDAVRVADFGLGKAGGVTTASIMQSGSVLTEGGRSISGTLAYMSPEQKQGGDVDGRSDLYACGIILFELLTGERPSGTEMPSSVRDEVPAVMDQVFSRSYTRLDRRYPSAEAMLEALSAAGPDRAAGGPPPVPTVVGRTCPKCGRPVGGDDNFCIHCGWQLVAEVPRCPSCRGCIKRQDRFCISCGTGLESRVG